MNKYPKALQEYICDMYEREDTYGDFKKRLLPVLTEEEIKEAWHDCYITKEIKSFDSVYEPKKK